MRKTDSDSKLITGELEYRGLGATPDSKVHVASMGPNWVLLAPGRPHVGSMSLAIMDMMNLTTAPWSNIATLLPCHAKLHSEFKIYERSISALMCVLKYNKMGKFNAVMLSLPQCQYKHDRYGYNWPVYFTEFIIKFQIAYTMFLARMYIFCWRLQNIKLTKHAILTNICSSKSSYNEYFWATYFSTQWQ